MKYHEPVEGDEIDLGNDLPNGPAIMLNTSSVEIEVLEEPTVAFCSDRCVPSFCYFGVGWGEF